MKATYDPWARQYTDLIDREIRDSRSVYHLVVDRILAAVGDVAGRQILDAGCGAGHLAEILVGRGACVTAIDISGELIEIARERDANGRIRYECRDVARGLPEYPGRFDIAIGNLVLNDTPEGPELLRAMGAATKAGGMGIVTLNNPYSAVIRGKVADYADSGAIIEYAGLARAGIHVTYHHRTMEELVDAARRAGYVIERLEDLIPPSTSQASELARRMKHFPYLMMLALRKSE